MLPVYQDLSSHLLSPFPEHFSLFSPPPCLMHTFPDCTPLSLSAPSLNVFPPLRLLEKFFLPACSYHGRVFSLSFRDVFPDFSSQVFLLFSDRFLIRFPILIDLAQSVLLTGLLGWSAPFLCPFVMAFQGFSTDSSFSDLVLGCPQAHRPSWLFLLPPPLGSGPRSTLRGRGGVPLRTLASVLWHLLFF